VFVVAHVVVKWEGRMICVVVINTLFSVAFKVLNGRLEVHLARLALNGIEQPTACRSTT
jgi:hypothetical protein